MDHGSKVLHYGACICLESTDDPKHYIHSQGFGDPSVYAVHRSRFLTKGSFTNCVFRVLPPLPNMAQIQIQEMLHSPPIGDKNSQQLSSTLTTLEENLEMEMKSNTDFFNKLKGVPIQFGSIIQLQHVTSQKFLSVKLEETADLERDNLKLILEPFVHENSNFEIMPAYEYQNDRDGMAYSEEYVFISTSYISKLKKSLFIHKSGITFQYLNKLHKNKKERANLEANSSTESESDERKIQRLLLSQEEGKEVNASLDQKSSWRIRMYTPYISDPQILRCGDNIWLYLSEANGVLVGKEARIAQTLVRTESNLLSQLKVQSFQGGEKRGSPRRGLLGRSSEIDAPPQFEVYIEKKATREAECLLDSYGIWKIENKDFTKGGAVRWDGEYRLKHLNSGLYLGIEPIDRRHKISKMRILTIQDFHMVLTSDFDEYSIFKFNYIFTSYQGKEISRKYDKLFLKKDNFLSLQHVKTKFFMKTLEMGSLNTNQSFAANLEDFQDGNEINSTNGSQLVVPTICKEKSGNDIFRAIKSNEKQLMESYFLLSCLPILDSAKTYLHPRFNAIQLEEPRKKFQLMRRKELIKKTLKDLSEFIESSKIEIASNETLQHRQKLFREQRGFEALINILNTTFPNEKELEKIHKLNTVLNDNESEIGDDFERKSIFLRSSQRTEKRISQNSPPRKSSLFRSFTTRNLSKISDNREKTESNMDLYTVLKLSNEMENVRKNLMICKEVYYLIMQLCFNNRENEIFVHQFVDTFIEQCRYIPEATQCIIQLITDNEKFLYSFGLAGGSMTNEVQNSIKFTDKHLLEMFEKHRNLSCYTPQFIELLRRIVVYKEEPISMNQEIVLKMLFKDQGVMRRRESLEIISEEEKDIEIESKTSSRKSLDLISRVSLKKGSRKHDILIDIYTDERKNIKFFSKPYDCFQSLDFLEDDHLEDELDFLTIQLKLYADLCKGRNYVCMDNIKMMFPLNTLSDHIWSKEEMPNCIRAALARLLLNIYIDNEPLHEVILPEICRIVHIGKAIKTLTNELPGEEMMKLNQSSFINFDTDPSQLEDDTETNQLLLKQPTFARRQSLFQNIAYSTNMYERRQGDRTGSSTSRNEAEEVETMSILDSLKTEILKFLKTNVVKTIHGQQKVSFNELSLEVIKIAKMFIMFGMFSNDYLQKGKELGDLIRSLFVILDFGEAKESTGAVLKQMSTVKNTNSPKKRMHSHGRESVVEGRKSRKQSEGVKTSVTGTIQLDDPILMTGYYNLKELLNKAYLDQNQKAQKAKQFEILIKIEICEIFLYLLNMRQDYLLLNSVNYFLYKISQYVTSGRIKQNLAAFLGIENRKKKQPFMPKILKMGISSIDNVQEEMMDFSRMQNKKLKKIDDIDKIVGQSILPTLIKVFYNATDFKLQYLSFELMRLCFTQRKQIICKLTQMQLLFNPADIHLYEFIQTKANILRSLVETSELWLPISLDEKKKMLESKKKAAQTLLILNDCNNVLSTHFTIERGKLVSRMRPDEDSKIDPGRQNLLRYLHVHKYILDFIRDNSNKIESLWSFQESSNSGQIRKILDLFSKSFAFLTDFVKSNPKHQKILSKELKLIMRHLKINLGQIDLITEIFRNNEKMCSTVTENFLRTFTHLIETEGRQSRFLEIFLVVQKTKWGYLPDTQRKVLNVLLTPNRSTRLLFMSRSKDHGHDKFTFNPDTSKILHHRTYMDEPFTYHRKLVEVLKISGAGETQLSICEAKCQKLIPLNYLLDILSGRDRDFEKYKLESYKVKLELMDFFYHIYLDTEKSVEELYFNKNLIGFIQGETSKMKEITEDSPNFESYIIYLFEYLLPIMNMCYKLFGTTLDDKAIFERDDINSLDSFCQAFLQENKKFLIHATSEKAKANFQEFRQKFKEMYEKILSKNPFMELNDIPIDFNQLKLIEDEADNKSSVPSDFEEENFSDVLSKADEAIDDNMKYVDKQSQPLIIYNIQNIGGNEEEVTKIETITSNINTYWKVFVRTLEESEAVGNICRKESHHLLMAFYNIESLEKIGTVITFEQFAQALLNFLQISYKKFNKKETTVAILSLLSDLIEKVSSDDEKAATQNKLIKLGAIDVSLQLLCDKDIQATAIIFNNLIFFCNQLLSRGNSKAQATCHQFFIESPNSELFFEKISNILQDQIDSVTADFDLQNSPEYCEKEKYQYLPGDSTSMVSKSKDESVVQIMRFCQQLTENHNTLLQNYLRAQTSSRKSFDLVTKIVKYLDSMVRNRNKEYFDKMILCLEVLTEFIQGPCIENQIAIIEAKLVETASEILSLEVSHEVFREQKARGEVKERERGRKKGFLGVDHHIRRGTGKSSLVVSGVQEEEKEKLDPWMISRIKYNFSLALMSLLEGPKNVEIRRKMMKILNAEVLCSNLVLTKQRFTELYGGKYSDEGFLHHEVDPILNLGNYRPLYYEIIIEFGFNLYNTLMKLIEDSICIMEGSQYEDISISLDQIDMEIQGLDLHMLQKSVSKTNRFQKNKTTHEYRNSYMFGKKFLDTIIFFKRFAGSVEIHRNGRIETAYFALPPFCNYLSSDMKGNCLDHINRISIKTKVTSIIDMSETMKSQMLYNMRISKVMMRSIVLGMIMRNRQLWKDFSFILTILLNIIILTSFSHNLSGPQLFFDYSESTTSRLIITMGIMQLIASIFILTFAFLKQSPLTFLEGYHHRLKKLLRAVRKPMYMQANDGGEAIENNGSVQLWMQIVSGAYGIFCILIDWEILFYTLYTIFSILGTFLSPFFFAFHFSEFLMRFPVLQSVVLSVWRPKYALFLTLVFFMIFQYVFTILYYYYFWTEFGGHCDTMLKCMVSVFDWTFKTDGGVGGFLTNNYAPEHIAREEGNLQMWRVLIDNMFNIIMLIIMINIVAGIIIDQFAIIRQEQKAKENDMKNFCLLCGRARDILDKSAKPGFGFNYHVKTIHSMWNYIFYICYIKTKESTEYTGIEYYVSEKLEKHDITWVPLFIEDEAEGAELGLKGEEAERIKDKMDSMEKRMIELSDKVGIFMAQGEIENRTTSRKSKGGRSASPIDRKHT